ncbi:secreted RxLR effector protein 161-like [Henckelia pumila]|uniref:secreted RxLR effector protein 161-like n=1 Tax=Henckelia pumila TaxID=405737 RepID=UPI003C6E16C5
MEQVKYEPSSYKSVMSSKLKDNWKKAMDEELQSLIKNETWNLVEKPKGKSKVIQRFTIHEVKSVGTSLGQHLRMSSDQSPSNDMEKEEMLKISYASGVGSIMYGMVCGRLDLAYTISVVSRYMTNLGKAHWEALKWTTMVLEGSVDLRLIFKKQISDHSHVIGYVDSDYVGNLDSRKSLIGLVFTVFGTVVSWKSILQLVVALSNN